MNELFLQSAFFGFALTLSAYLFGNWLKKKTGLPVFNPLFVGSLLIICLLLFGNIKYETYYEGAKYISYLLTPATVCLAVPLYKQLTLLRKNLAAVIAGIASGVAASAVSIFLMCQMFRTDHELYVSLLPKSITTAIGIGVCEEAGGIVTVTVISIILTGILGSMIAEKMFRLLHISDPIAKGLALGTSAHAIGTAKALELGEVEGAMSSLSIAVAGLMTVAAVPFAAMLM